MDQQRENGALLIAASIVAAIRLPEQSVDSRLTETAGIRCAAQQTDWSMAKHESPGSSPGLLHSGTSRSGMVSFGTSRLRGLTRGSILVTTCRRKLHIYPTDGKDKVVEIRHELTDGVISVLNVFQIGENDKDTKERLVAGIKRFTGIIAASSNHNDKQVRGAVLLRDDYEKILSELSSKGSSRK